MAQEYVALKEQNNDGMIAISKSAFETIAKNVVDEEEQIKLADGNSLIKKALAAKIVNEQLVLSLEVKVKYNVNVNDVCSKVQAKIFENIEHMTGYTPDVIDIRVTGFLF
ncbi:MAG: Asp23/Gls24 family envelope stress response protein [Longicatena sp.]|nr:Asp23/Gls24 family envelope stress response protein [Longicatena sp.]